MLGEIHMRFTHAFAVLAVAASLSATAAAPIVPTKVSYQGYLTSGGSPVNATVSMNVKLYDALTNGNLIWSEVQSVGVVNGVYNVVLGNTTPLDESVFTGQLYLTVAVGTDSDMSPRTPLTSAPYAIVAKKLDGTLGVTNGGTGSNNVATGGLLYGNGTSALGVTGAGSAGQVLTATAGGVPQWSSSTAPAGLTISHPVSVTLQGVTFNGGNIELGGSKAISVGGTQVLGAQQTAIANAVDATGVDVASAGPTQVVTVAEFNALVAQLNAALTALRNHGLIAP
jgi:hypothetical protein